MKKVILLSLAACFFATACEKNDLGFTKDGLPINCAPNEIIYKTQYGYPIELKIGEKSSGAEYDDFGGAKLVANICEREYCKYIFDADITKIPYRGFSGRISLTSMIIPDRVTSIGHEAFYNCTSLKEVYCKATTPPRGEDYMFNKNASGRKIYVPTASVDAYKAADGWSDYADHIVGYDF